MQRWQEFLHRLVPRPAHGTAARQLAERQLDILRAAHVVEQRVMCLERHASLWDVSRELTVRGLRILM